MKEALKPLHIAILAILLAVGGLYLYGGQQQQRHDEAARAYLQQALADISRWQPDALDRHLADRARAAVTAEQQRALLDRYRALGELQSLQDVRYERLTAALSAFSGDTLLGYSAEARFAHGTAHVTATLILEDGRLRLYNFNLGSPQLDAPPRG